MKDLNSDLFELEAATPDPILCQVAYALFCHHEQNEALFQGDLQASRLTAAAIAKRLHLNIDQVKQKLKRLHESQLVRVYGLNPKVYQWDPTAFYRLSDTDPLYAHFWGAESPFSGDYEVSKKGA